MLDRCVKFQDLKPLPPVFPTLVSMVIVSCRMVCPTSHVSVDLDIQVGTSDAKFRGMTHVYYCILS